jgi:hypothetical protein
MDRNLFPCALYYLIASGVRLQVIKQVNAFLVLADTRYTDEACERFDSYLCFWLTWHSATQLSHAVGKNAVRNQLTHCVIALWRLLWLAESEMDRERVALNLQIDKLFLKLLLTCRCCVPPDSDVIVQAAAMEMLLETFSPSQSMIQERALEILLLRSCCNCKCKGLTIQRVFRAIFVTW